MREIKFRIWDDGYKYMNYKVLVGMWGDNVLDEENYTACSMWIEPKNVDYKCEPHWCHFEPYHKEIKLMQYTGFKDVNGKDIYEGDIVKYFLEENAVIKYINGAFMIESNTNMDCMCSMLGKIEIIGSIYENKELLNI